MVVSMTACGNSEAGGSKDSAKNNGNGDEPYTVTMVLNGSTQPDEERIEQKINEILEPELNANLDIVVLPWASASQQLQLMLSGDEKIDVFYTQATNAVQYMNAGKLRPGQRSDREYACSVTAESSSGYAGGAEVLSERSAVRTDVGIL